MTTFVTVICGAVLVALYGFGMASFGCMAWTELKMMGHANHN